MVGPEAMLRREVDFDPLTGLLSGVGMRKHLGVLNEEQPGNYSFLMIDIDGLKTTNDQMGHDAGDRLLIKAGAVIQESLRTDTIETDFDRRQIFTPIERDAIAARMMGDEFAAAIPGVNTPEGLAVLIRRIERNLTNEGIEASINGRPHAVNEDSETLINDSDQLMLKTKEERKEAKFRALPRRKQFAARFGEKFLRYAGVNPPRQ